MTRNVNDYDKMSGREILDSLRKTIQEYKRLNSFSLKNRKKVKE